MSRNKYEIINTILGEIEELKKYQDLTRSELNTIENFSKPIRALRNHWAFDEGLEKQAREFYRDLRGTVHGDDTSGVRAMTLQEIAVAMNISIITATKFVHVSANRGWILTWFDNNYLV